MDQIIEVIKTNPYVHFVILGFVIGMVSRILMPGPDPMGIIKTTLLGMAGSLLAGYLVTAFDISNPIPAPWGTYVASILGAFGLLLVFKVIRNIG